MFRHVLILVGLLTCVAQAEEKKTLPQPAPEKKALPDAMPLKAAQDLDYLIFTRNRKTMRILEKYQKLATDEIQQATKTERETVQEVEKKYSIRLFDDKGQAIDKVDFETGKITRKTAPPK